MRDAAPLPSTLNPFSPGYVDARCVICGLHEHPAGGSVMDCIAAYRAWEQATTPQTPHNEKDPGVPVRPPGS
jgi:hypothetical protein